jgi:hypothetical protein
MKIKLTLKNVTIGVVAALALGVFTADLINGHSGGGRQDTAVPQTGDAPAPDSGLLVPATVGTAATSSAAAAGTSSPAGDDGDDDGTVDQAAPTATIDPAAKEAVTAFTAAWLNTYKVTPDQWRAGILPRVTEDMAAALADADPATVPDGGRVGTVTMGLDSQLTVADVKVAAAAGPAATLGTLHLSVVDHNGTWLISEIDWAAAK